MGLLPTALKYAASWVSESSGGISTVDRHRLRARVVPRLVRQEPDGGRRAPPASCGLSCSGLRLTGSRSPSSFSTSAQPMSASGMPG